MKLKVILNNSMSSFKMNKKFKQKTSEVGFCDLVKPI